MHARLQIASVSTGSSSMGRLVTFANANQATKGTHISKMAAKVIFMYIYTDIYLVYMLNYMYMFVVAARDKSSILGTNLIL